MSEKLSVAVNTWDRPDCLELFLRSFFENTRDLNNVELCVALDGSPQESIDLVKDSGLSWIWNEHVGLSYSINQAFDLCSNPYVAWFSDDYILMPGWDEALQKYLHPDHFISVDTFESFNSPFPAEPMDLNYESLMSYYPEVTSTLTGELGYTFGNGIFDRVKARNIGGFDEDLIEGSMDGDFIYRMHKEYPELVFFRPGDITFYHFSKSTRKNHAELSDNDDDAVFLRKHGHERGGTLYGVIKKHCANKGYILEARGVVL